MLPSARILILSWLACTLAGCAAFRPINGIPAAYLPEEYTPLARSPQKTIDLSLLRQPPCSDYRVDAHDVLGIYVEGVLGDVLPPIHLPQDKELAPSVGYPIPVWEDGTISLPLVPPICVRGMTFREVEQRIRQAYTQDRPLLVAGQDRILISLQKPRSVRVLVMRQEAGNSEANHSVQGTNILINEKRGAGRVVLLPAYKNDVLHALAESGGLPGLDAQNVIYVMRNGMRDESVPAYHGPATADYGLASGPPAAAPWPAPGMNLNPAGWGHSAPPLVAGAGDPAQDWVQFHEDSTLDNPSITKIPLRITPGDPLGFEPQDVVLHDGDVVFIESREREFFFTGGLLGGGQFVLPRDQDLDILGAIAVAEGHRRTFLNRPTKANGGVSVLNQDVTVGASLVTILRRLPDGRQVPIQVDLYRAMKDPAERILIQPGDHILLRYGRVEAVAALLERHLLEGFLIGAATTLMYNGD